MKINNRLIINACFIISIIAIIIGVLFKIMHLQNAQMLLIIGVVATLIYWAIAIYEIVVSKRLDTTEKLFWVFGFIIMTTLAGLIYIVSARKNIVMQ